MLKRTILFIDDEEDILKSLSADLTHRGYRVLTTPDGSHALDLMEKESVDLVLLDLYLTGLSGMEVLGRLKSLDPALPVIILTGNAQVATAVAAMKAGADDLLSKPFANEELALAVERTFKQKDMLYEMQALRENVRVASKNEEIFIGQGPATGHLMEQIRAVAPTALTVFVQGPSGAGKEIVARLVHALSLHRDGPFVALDCGALPESLIESELFGYEKGAFTGADRTKLGQFELAYRGTLFLDEVGNLPVSLQAKLLRALETRSIRRLGGKKDIAINARIIAATNQDPQKALRQGSLREDLFYRLNQFSLVVPALRRRKEDIPMLARHFLKQANASLGKKVSGIGKEALALLEKHDWPGNVRELKNAITRACLLAEDTIKPQHLTLSDGHLPGFALAGKAPEKRRNGIKSGLASARLQAEKKLILEVLKKTKNNKRRAAAILGLSRSILYLKLRKMGIS